MKKIKTPNIKYENDFYINAGYKLAFFVLFIFFSADSLFSQNPQNAVIEYITVNHATEKPIIYWNHPDPSSIDGYIIKRFIYQHPTVLPNTYHTIDTINNPNIFEYEDFSVVKGPSLPYIRNEIYRIVAFKLSGPQMFLSTMSDLHKTIFVDSEYEYCEKRNKIIWSQYKGWNNNFIDYRVYSSLNGGIYNYIGNTSPGDTTFYHENVLSNNSYHYYVQAYKSTSVISESNINELYTDAPQRPNFLYTDSVIVFENSSINLYFDIDETAETERYELYKSQQKTTEYSLIEEYTDKNLNYISYIDNEVDIHNLNYYYMVAKDYCNNDVISSDTVNNIVLTSEKSYNSDYIVNNSWTENINISDNIVYRTYNSIEFENIFNTQDYFFEDDISNFYREQYDNHSTVGEFCYYIRTYDNIKNRIYISNSDCITPKEKIFMPNAFNPKSNVEENRIFKPKQAFVSDYLFSIYNRWGVKVFETKSPNEGWDGKLSDGKIAPIQTFIYYLRYKNSTGKTITMKGHVNLVY